MSLGAGNTYKIDVTQANTYGGEPFEGLTDITLNETSESVDQGTDGAPYVAGHYNDNLKFNITINGVDGYNAFTLGQEGILVIHTVRRVNGKDNDTSTVTYTFNNAILDDTSTTVNHQGVSTISYTFSCVSSDGVTRPVAIS